MNRAKEEEACEFLWVRRAESCGEKEGERGREVGSGGWGGGAHDQAGAFDGEDIDNGADRDGHIADGLRPPHFPLHPDAPLALIGSIASSTTACLPSTRSTPTFWGWSLLTRSAKRRERSTAAVDTTTKPSICQIEIQTQKGDQGRGQRAHAKGGQHKARGHHLGQEKEHGDDQPGPTEKISSHIKGSLVDGWMDGWLVFGEGKRVCAALLPARSTANQPTNKQTTNASYSTSFPSFLPTRR